MYFLNQCPYCGEKLTVARENLDHAMKSHIEQCAWRNIAQAMQEKKALKARRVEAKAKRLFTIPETKSRKEDDNGLQ